jgi:hypothetical protein
MSERPLDPALGHWPGGWSRRGGGSIDSTTPVRCSIYQQLAQLYPGAADPVHAQAEVLRLRVDGRRPPACCGDWPWRRIRRRLSDCSLPNCFGGLAGFPRPGASLINWPVRALMNRSCTCVRVWLARSEGLDAAAETWLREGLERFPHATVAGPVSGRAMVGATADGRELAAMLAENSSAAWCNPDMLSAAWP